MDQIIGVVRLQPSPDLDRLLAVMEEDPREVIPQARHFLEHGRPDPAAQARAHSLICYTAACVLRQSTLRAVAHGREAVRLARLQTGLEAEQLLFDSLINLGAAAERIGEYREAVTAYREALGMPVSRIGRSQQVEAVLGYLAQAYYYGGQQEEALEALARASVMARARLDPYASELLHCQRGACYLKTGELERAEESLNRAAAATNSTCRYDLKPKGQIMAKLAVLHMLTGDSIQSERYAQAAQELGDGVGEPLARVEARMVLARWARERGDVGLAVRLSGEAACIAHEYGYVPLLQEMAWLLQRLYPAEGLSRPSQTGVAEGGVPGAHWRDC